MKILITGRPGTGKSTVVGRAVEIFRQKGLKVGGIVCPDVRENGVRSGFEMIDLINGKRGLLASTRLFKGPTIGRYFVNIPEIEATGVTAVRRAMAEADLIVIDEIGPMEMKSMAFQKVVKEALDGSKNILAVVHWSSVKQFSSQSVNSILLEVKPDNREMIVQKIIELFSEGSPNYEAR